VVHFKWGYCNFGPQKLSSEAGRVLPGYVNSLIDNSVFVSFFVFSSYQITAREEKKPNSFAMLTVNS